MKKTKRQTPLFFTLPEMAKANPKKWKSAAAFGGGCDLFMTVLGFEIELAKPPIRPGFETARVDWQTIGRN